MGGIEGLSIPFAFDVEATSARSDIEADELLGKAVTIHLELGLPDHSVRHWNGHVSKLEYVETGNDGLSRYGLTLRPWLWQLGLNADCRIFQNLSVPDIVEQVFRDRQFSDFERSLFGTYEAYEYVVQYRESDLEFRQPLGRRSVRLSGRVRLIPWCQPRRTDSP